MTYKHECVDTDVLETRSGIRVLANNEIASVSGAGVWDAYSYGKAQPEKSEQLLYLLAAYWNAKC
ncbi:MAG TPA: hypothetical protein VF471_05625 [Pseudoxanthomonas sp.]